MVGICTKIGSRIGMQVGYRQAHSWTAKLCWADIVSKQLKICKTDKDWREVAHIWGEWNLVLKTRVGEINVEGEDLEKVRKNNFKQRIYSQRHRQSYIVKNLLVDICPEVGKILFPHVIRQSDTCFCSQRYPAFKTSWLKFRNADNRQLQWY